MPATSIVVSSTSAERPESNSGRALLKTAEELERFHAGLDRLDAMLASDMPLNAPAERLIQGPLADALTHIGQIALMRRMAGASIRGENFFAAEIGASVIPDF
jgi:hypothetical protein